MRELGFETDVEPERVQAIADPLAQRGIAELPDERALLAGVGLEEFYARVYRYTSDVLHFSVFAALDGFRERPDRATGAGAVVALEMPDRERAAEALTLAALTFGVFLEKCEPIIPHGVTETARRELEAALD